MPVRNRSRRRISEDHRGKRLYLKTLKMRSFVILCILASFCILQATGAEGNRKSEAAEKLLKLQKNAKDLSKYVLDYENTLKENLQRSLRILYLNSELERRNISMIVQDRIREQVDVANRKGKDAEKCYMGTRVDSQIVLRNFDEEMKECSAVYIRIIRPFEEKASGIVDDIEYFTTGTTELANICNTDDANVARACLDDLPFAEQTLKNLRKDAAAIIETGVTEFDEAYNKSRACERSATAEHTSRMHKVEDKAMQCIRTA